MAELTPTPRITGIIIFFNEAKYLEEAVESVLAQTFDGWELLLCDDGSSDGSSAIAKRFAEQDPRIRYLEHDGHQNKGMSATRNLGLGQARGREIAFLDGDDVWLPDKLEKQAEILDRYPEAAMTFGPLLEWHSWAPGGGRDELYCVNRSGRHPFENTFVPAPDMLTLFLDQQDFIPSGVLFRHDAFKAVGGFEDAFRGSYEDAVFHVKMCARFPVYVHAQAFYKYRIHPESCERQNTPDQKRRAHRRFLEWTRDYIADQGITDPAVNRAWADAYECILDDRLYRARQGKQSLLDRIELALIHAGRRVLPHALRDRLWALRNHLR